jgi:hypothetical protein
MRRALLTIGVCLFAAVCHAGGTQRVAGTTGFNAGLAGTPLTWAGGQIAYYTDQGDLSPLEKQAGINALVADAFSRWTSVTTAALTAARAGALDEDVSGINVTRVGNVLTMPADIQPSSIKPVAIVYDTDGKVTDALLGAGASQVCGANMVFGGADSFTPDAHIAHALLVLNGSCVKTSGDIPLLRYRLIRAIGRVLGLDWSPLNDNVATGVPAPTTDDYNGFPLMHPAGSLCTPSYGCTASADQLRADDRAAISRLYPVTPANAGQFTGKQVFAAATARVRGSVLLSSTPIQGANIVARLIESGKATTKASVGCVSGFLFRGNAGNPVTGFDSNGERFDHWGSDDQALRGFFDLSGLVIPAGSTSAQYELRVEPINSAYAGALAAGPYHDAQVLPPGAAAPIVVTVTAGDDIVQDITLQTSLPSDDIYEPHSFAAPAALPGGGTWAASLDPYGDLDWHALPLRAGRSFTVDIVALDDTAAPSTRKALPVIGLWDPSADASDPPLVSRTYFNAAASGSTRLQASVPADGVYKLAVGDYRGDGRPDFRYRARVLYADAVSPGRARPEGGTVVTVTGIGFSADTTVKIGSVAATLLSFAPERLLAVAPAMADGTYAVTVEDSVTGATAAVSNALSYGGASSDVLELLEGYNPPVPVGATAPNPFRVRVLAAGNTTPVSGAAMRFQSPSTAVLLLPCGTRDCTVSTDAAGEAMAWLSVKSAGATTLTASLGNGASVSATVVGVASPLAVSAAPPKSYVAKNTAASVPLLTRVVGSGAPLPGRLVDFQVMMGAGTVAPASVMTDANGEARATLTIANMTSEVRLSACVGVPPQTACDIFYVYAVAAAATRLENAGGDAQWVAPGKPFAPLTVRVTDAGSPPQMVAGAAVSFHATAYQEQDAAPRAMRGEVTFGRNPQVIALGSADARVNTNGWGLASFTPSFPQIAGAAVIEIVASAGGQQITFTLHTWPGMLGTSSAHASGIDRIQETGASTQRTQRTWRKQFKKPLRPPRPLRQSPGRDY